MKTAYIINPFSAKKNYQNFLTGLKSKVENPLVLVSKSIEDSFNFIKENWDDVDVFVAIGGDGTISTVASKLVNTDKILAVFPAGSGNGFSNETNFSKNIDKLLKKLEKREFKLVDSFMINNNLSINVSGVGLDGNIIEGFEHSKRGFSNYIKITVEKYFKFKPIKVKFEEKYKNFDGEYMMVNVANTRQFGNNAYIAPQADMSDGKVELALVKKFPLPAGLTFAYQMFTKSLKPGKYLQYISTSEISFSVDSEAWHLDGEYYRIKSPIHIRVLPQSLRILI
ncbi:diacylglycerol/lipid kinase family protein [Soonwooa purpurea]